MATRDHAKEIDDVRKDIEALRADIGKLSDSLSADVKSNAARVAEDVRTRAANVASEASDQIRAGSEAIGQRVEEHPIASMAVAFGAGMVIGRLLNR